MILVAYLLFVILAWKRLNWAVLLTIVGLPTYLIRFQIESLPLTFLEGMILIVFLVWLTKHQKFNIPYRWPLLLFLLSATIGVFVSPDLRAALGIWKAYFIEPALFFVVLYNLKIDKKQIITALGLSILIPGLFAIFQKFTGLYIENPLWTAEATRRVVSFYGYPNAIGLYFAPISLLLLTRVIALFKNQRMVALCYLFLSLIGFTSVVFAVSKGALLGIFVGFVFLAIFWKGYRLLFFGIVIVSLIFGLLNPSFRSLTGTPTVAGGGSLEIRTGQWSETLSMLRNNPILGAGLSGYQEALKPFHQKQYIEIFLYPHNIILNFWSEIGLVGLIAFVWLMVLFYRGRTSIPLLGTMTVLLIHGLVDVPYFKNDLAMLFWILYYLGSRDNLIWWDAGADERGGPENH